jgi:hypothetical protein
MPATSARSAASLSIRRYARRAPEKVEGRRGRLDRGGQPLLSRVSSHERRSILPPPPTTRGRTPRPSNASASRAAGSDDVGAQAEHRMGRRFRSTVQSTYSA